MGRLYLAAAAERTGTCERTSGCGGTSRARGPGSRRRQGQQQQQPRAGLWLLEARVWAAAPPGGCGPRPQTRRPLRGPRGCSRSSSSSRRSGRHRRTRPLLEPAQPRPQCPRSSAATSACVCSAATRPPSCGRCSQHSPRGGCPGRRTCRQPPTPRGWLRSTSVPARWRRCSYQSSCGPRRRRGRRPRQHLRSSSSRTALRRCGRGRSWGPSRPPRGLASRRLTLAKGRRGSSHGSPAPMRLGGARSSCPPQRLSPPRPPRPSLRSSSAASKSRAGRARLPSCRRRRPSASRSPPPTQRQRARCRRR